MAVDPAVGIRHHRALEVATTPSVETMDMAGTTETTLPTVLVPVPKATPAVVDTMRNR